MDLNITPRARVLAVLALILFAGGTAYLIISSSESPSADDSKPIVTNHTRTQTTRTATTEKRTKPKKPTEGLVALDAALISHPVVVVSLYAPSVDIDEAAREEAEAGAAAVGAGFVAFNVYDEKQARQLAVLLGDGFVATNPEVLFFKRPRSLAFELRGFADSQVVAQAAKTVHPVTEPWIDDANRICRRYSVSLAPTETKARGADLGTTSGRKQAADALEQAASFLGQEIEALQGIHPNVANAERFSRLLANLRQAAENTTSEAKALRSNNLDAAQAAEKKNTTVIESINELAEKLQLSSCAA